METIIATWTIETHDGRRAIFDVAYDPEQYEGQRVYARGTTLYYTPEVFQRGIPKAKTAECQQVADLFEHPASVVIDPRH